MINYIDPKMPPQTIFSKLYENDKMVDGKADRALSNMVEIDGLYNTLGITSGYDRDNLLNSYTNWSHVEAGSGYSVWKYPVSGLINNSYNALYRNNNLLAYQGVATSSSTPVGFSKVFLGDSKRSGETLVDYTTEAASVSGTPFNITNYTTVTQETCSAIIGTKNLNYLNVLNGSLFVANNTLTSGYIENSDYTVDYTNGTLTFLNTGNIVSGAQLYISYNASYSLYIGNSSTYSSIFTKLASVGVGNSIKLAYSSGSNWTYFAPSNDGTNNFSASGSLDLGTLPTWGTRTISSGTSLYWTRITNSYRNIGSPMAYYIVKSDSAATKLVQMSPTDFSSNNYKWCYYNSNIYVAVPNGGDTVNEGNTYVLSSSTSTVKQNFFQYNNEYILNYKINVADNDVNLTGVTTLGGATNHTKFEVDGTLVMSGTATVWNDINTSALAIKTTGPSSPTLTALNSSSIKSLAFVGTGVQLNEGWGSMEILHDYKHGSDIIPHVHWMPTTNGAGNVNWLLDYYWENGASTYTTPTTINVVVAGGGVAWKEMRTNFPTITGTGKTIGGRFIYRLYRDPADVADTYGADALLLDFGVHYEIDTLGSRTVNSK